MQILLKKLSSNTIKTTISIQAMVLILLLQGCGYQDEISLIRGGHQRFYIAKFQNKTSVTQLDIFYQRALINLATGWTSVGILPQQDGLPGLSVVIKSAKIQRNSPSSGLNLISLNSTVEVKFGYTDATAILNTTIAATANFWEEGNFLETNSLLDRLYSLAAADFAQKLEQALFE